jgi:dolichol-phosphate mannosyltransferase
MYLNEIENIESIIRAVLSQHKLFHVLIVDDNSLTILQTRFECCKREFEGRLFLENRMKENRFRYCLCAWFQVGLGNKYDFILKWMPILVTTQMTSKSYDASISGTLLIGSRYVTGVNVVNWPLNRVLLSYFASVYVHYYGYENT